MDDKQTLQLVLNKEIPLTQSMGIEVISCDQYSVRLFAPLSRNINHKCTAFGGSLYSLAVLAGWGLIYLKLKEYDLSGHIVIQQSEIDYLHPVEGDLSSECEFESDQQIEKLIQSFKKFGKARISLQAKILWNTEVAVSFNGKYVIHS